MAIGTEVCVLTTEYRMNALVGQALGQERPADGPAALVLQHA